MGLSRRAYAALRGFQTYAERPQLRTRAPKAHPKRADPDFCSVTGG